ncbi:MAG: tRNA 5-methoxyuridine(34)/uridine 5-oxyacetic acid(34) synthase CmoB [Desulfobulbaceae bacterium]|uniref:tRNA 5-methoxyuridine(34)/uridine 5-oxyacetic acid(34) synthase CmoB n=1 Tax=Candidatus Desulfatifera sulfidica TaxID=2841691 RepID=A0A8J6N8D0_9BACT|nr:tRNA 5-methoxyuridine(34)/uridine 5-oxyacetic acid(34) synthase CmoB [Candidatus Desulfatifera sulfidica]
MIQAPSYLDRLPESALRAEIINAHQDRQRWVLQDKKGFLRYRRPFESIAPFRAQKVDCSRDTVLIGEEGEIRKDGQQIVHKALRAFMPWRKGPFSVFGTHVDAEWRSERKWQRLLPRLPDLNNKIVADIGCNNGYYMFRMAHHEPRLVLGLEPSVQHYYCFKTLNHMAAQEMLDIDLLGVEHLNLFPSCFDIIFLMGIIYHRPSPIETLRDILGALRPGGTLILETQAIPGDAPLALFPETTYAKVPGTYFIPTGACLINWLTKAGYSKIELFSRSAMSSEEQRSTDWMTFESYADFINPENPTLTIEGYPAPERILIRGTK